MIYLKCFFFIYKISFLNIYNLVSITATDKSKPPKFEKWEGEILH